MRKNFNVLLRTYSYRDKTFYDSSIQLQIHRNMVTEGGQCEASNLIPRKKIILFLWYSAVIL